ncbi:MAG: type IV pilus twitching motility protein PilT [Candidatus Dadabacteria bacterium]|nr:MAG: type IV pilus twitching motility protein PilT [Candidatus Dadabacteria bacterium]
MAKIDRYFQYMIKKGASDLHISCGSVPLMRVSGDLEPVGDTVMNHKLTTELLFEIMSEKQRAEFKRSRDLDFAYEPKGLGARFRANVFVGRLGMGAVFRTIPSEILTAEQLGLPPAILSFGQLTKGLVLVTGGTGSGKSTTLAAVIDHINKTRRDHILTLEDPIEFVHKNHGCLVNQREVHNHTESFARALKAALRQDPDVILVGEMRDLETIELAITAAETGHVVFGTLHTSSAAKTVDRIINVFPTDQQEQIRTMLAESLKGVVAQVLCKKIGGGRIAAQEILVVNRAVANLIRENRIFQIPGIMQTARREGMQLMDQALMDLLQQKQIEPEEAWRYATDKEQFTRFLPKKQGAAVAG